jgi:hypothetical protein
MSYSVVLVSTVENPNGYNEIYVYYGIYKFNDYEILNIEFLVHSYKINFVPPND